MKRILSAILSVAMAASLVAVSYTHLINPFPAARISACAERISKRESRLRVAGSGLISRGLDCWPDRG